MCNNTSSVCDNETESSVSAVQSVEVKIAFLFVACVSITASATAITCMHRAKNIPYAAKFLSTGLLVFDVLFIVTSTVTHFVLYPTIINNMQTLVTLWLQLITVTITLMAIERYVLILKPMWYLNNVTEMKIRITVVSIWITEGSIWLLVRYGVCYIKFQSVSVFTKPRLCKGFMIISHMVLLIFGLVISFMCYWKIFRLIQSKVHSGRTTSVSDTAKEIRTYRSTSIVFVYIVVITCITVAYVIILYMTKRGLISESNHKVSIEIVSIGNCILDPFLYVMWLKECRLELFKCIAVVFKRYRHRVEEMRMDIYNIVTTDCKPIVNSEQSLLPSATREALR